MGIPIEKSFEVKAPAGAVWDFLTDPRRVAGCLPGAAITEKVDDTSPPPGRRPGARAAPTCA
jgi:carbon monoxide dehydrogenase subunit G